MNQTSISNECFWTNVPDECATRCHQGRPLRWQLLGSVNHPSVNHAARDKISYYRFLSITPRDTMKIDFIEEKFLARQTFLIGSFEIILTNGIRVVFFRRENGFWNYKINRKYFLEENEGWLWRNYFSVDRRNNWRSRNGSILKILLT